MSPKNIAPKEQSHTGLVNEILLKLGDLPHIRVWKNSTGCAQTPSGHFIKFGLVGSADILGIRAPTGQLIAIECKTGKARQSKEQKAFEKMITAFGGIYVVARLTSDIEFLT